MISNMNYNNNHNPAEPQDDEERINSMPQSEALQETRQVVKRFLERSLSQSAKSSMPFMKPEGYHKLKKDGRLPHYQRQQSKPEQGSLLKRPGIGRRKSAGATTAMQVSGAWSGHTSRASLSEQKNISVAKDQQSKYLSESDVRTVQRLSESEVATEEQRNSLMFQLLSAQAASQDNSSQSFDSIPSASDGGPCIRRESFTKAVSRKSVISDIERNNAPVVAKGTSGGTSTHIRQSSTPAAVTHHVEGAPRIDRQYSCRAEAAGGESTLSCDIHVNREDEKPKKATSFRERMKKIMSKQKKLKKVKPAEASKIEAMTSEDGGRRPDDIRPHSAGVRMAYSTEEEFRRENNRHLVQSTTGSISPSTRRESHKHVPLLRHKSPSHSDRSPSPSKAKSPHSTPTLIQRAFSMKKSSPKPKRRLVHHSGSSSSLSLYGTVHETNGEIEKHKSGSLPTSMRYGIHLQPGTGTRRFSEDLLSPKESKKSLKRSPSPSHKHHHEHHEHHRHHDHNHHHRHHHENDVEEKKSKSVGILRKIFRFRKFRKRHASESSTASSRSHSLPSIPAALEQERGPEESLDCSADVNNSHSHAENGDSVGKLPSSDEHKPFHHRGSLSFSSGDISLLSAPEHQKVIDEIADALRRVSQKYTKRLQSRSNPSSRYVTPESSLTTADYQQYNKLPRSGPPSRQTSITRSPVHSTGKSFRKYDKTEKRPALAAYYNLSRQRRGSDPRLDKSAAVMPRPIHHSKSGSLDSPLQDFSDRRLPVPNITLQQPSPPRPSSPLGEDVVDGVPLSKSADVFSSEEGNMKETNLYTETEFFSMISTQTDGSTLTETQVDFTSAETILVNEERITYGEPRPSTSKESDDECDDDMMDDSNNPYTEQIDEDKLVKMIVEALIKKGDDINRRMEPDCTLPVFQSSIFSFITRMSFRHFCQFANRFCSTCKRLVESSPTRHPEIFPVVMVFNMTQYMLSMASNVPTNQTLNRIYEYTTQFINDLVVDSGNTWESVLAQLRDTEEELTQEDWDEEVD